MIIIELISITMSHGRDNSTHSQPESQECPLSLNLRRRCRHFLQPSFSNVLYIIFNTIYHTIFCPPHRSHVGHFLQPLANAHVKWRRLVDFELELRIRAEARIGWLEDFLVVLAKKRELSCWRRAKKMSIWSELDDFVDGRFGRFWEWRNP